MQAARSDVVILRYWAAARAAAGVASDTVEGPLTVAAAKEYAVDAHGPALERVLAVCSVLVDDAPSTSADPANVVVQPGQTVEFLPPFAGG